ncbi:MAG TPA: LysR family transcriptional regulator [Micromonosporaceae bacterium]
MDLEAVRTFVAASDAGQFQEAAAMLSITQQAVSKRIAALENELDVRLFTRTPRGAVLTIDGQAFLPHARELLRVAERADASIRPGRRALRVDVTNRRTAPAVLLRGFYQMHPAIELDVLTLSADADGAVAAVEAGTIDATFHAVADTAALPPAIRALPVIDEPHQLLVGPAHPLAGARSLTPWQLAGHRIWMAGSAFPTEVGAYYRDLAAAFGITIDTVGPVFGNEALLAEIADSDLSTLIGERSQYLWPDSYDLRRIPLRGPTPVYPLSLIWRADNPHPALQRLRDFLIAARVDVTDAWVPSWLQATQNSLPSGSSMTT